MRVFRIKNKLFFSGEYASFEAEKIRSVEVNLQFLLQSDEKKKKILFTSADKNEGKTLCISNIALELSKKKKKVLLIDLDLRNPRLTTEMGKKTLQGVTEIVQKEVPWESVVVSLNQDHLYFLPTGSLPLNPLELLHSKKFAHLMSEVEKVYDYVFIDTPPVTLIADGLVIAQLCDGIVLIVREGETRIQVVNEAKKLLEQTGTPLLGAILNGTKYSKKERRSYDYY